MLKTALAAILIAGFATNAMAIDGPKYDRRIEAAVKKIVAKKVGDIRGPFNTETQPVLAVGNNEAAADIDASAQSTEMPLVQVASLDVALRSAFLSPFKYHSGRPEPVRRVQKPTSFQYF